MVCQYSKHLYTTDIPYKLLKERKKDKKDLTELAIDICIPDISGNAHANHGPLWQSVLDSAVSVLTAGREDGTGVAAHLGQAGQAAGTVRIYTTLGLRLRN